MEVYLPPTFNIETGRMDEPRLIDEQGNIVNEAEVDIFELARLRGTTVRELMELQSTSKQQEELAQRGTRHTKKDYERLDKLFVGDIAAMTKEQRETKPFVDESMTSIVKVQKKKASKKKVSKQQRERDLEIQKMLTTPQDINYDKAMEMYKDQPLEATEITSKDMRRLQRLKNKAVQEIKVTPSSVEEP